jgi:hypothetical protein
MILELTTRHADWFGALSVALTRPPGVAERRAGEDPWNPAPTARPRRISDDLAWFRYAIDHPADHGLRPVDEGLHSAWEVATDDAGARLERLAQRGVLEAAGFVLHQPDYVAG